MNVGERDLATRMLRGLRIAQSVIVLAILLLLNLPTLLTWLPAYRPPWSGLALWGTLLAVAVVDAALVARDRSWGRARWPAALVVLAIAVLSCVVLAPSELSAPAHVTLGVAGWFWVLLFADTRLSDLVGLVVLHLVVVLGFLVAEGRADLVTLVSFGTTAVAVSAFQLALGIAASALRTVAHTAAVAAAEEAADRTAEDVAVAVHTDREARYAELRAVALPLLVGIADGSRPPSEPDVQRQAAGAAARMRRMFAEEGDTGDPLAVALASVIDAAERRGVVVRYSERGPRAVPPATAQRALLAAATAALDADATSARVTLAGVGGAVAVGVVTDGVLPDGALADDGTDAADVRTTTTVGDGRTWVETRWSPRS